MLAQPRIRPAIMVGVIFSLRQSAPSRTAPIAFRTMKIATARPEELKTKSLFPDYYTWLFEVVGYKENFFGQPRFVHGPLV